MISIGSVMKVLGERKTFIANHPAFLGFILKSFSENMPQGTMIELSVKKPGEEGAKERIYIKESDEKMISAVGELVRQIIE